MTKLAIKLAAMSLAVAASGSALAAPLYISNFGQEVADASNCDDCATGAISLGEGQSIQLFGQSYSALYISSNGYVTFGGPRSDYSPQPMNVQAIAPMIAGYYTDLDSRDDAASKVWFQQSLGQIVITWDQMGHFSGQYNLRSTFQVVVRSDQYAQPTGQGQIGFFFGDMNDANTGSAGFGDGLSAINPGEEAFHFGPGSALHQHPAAWYRINDGRPDVVPEPASLALTGLALLGLGLARRKISTKA